MSSWHERMADAVRLRQKAVNGVARWNEKLAEAEKVIEVLSNERQAVVGDLAVEVTVTPPPNPEIKSDLRPVFGITE